MPEPTPTKIATDKIVAYLPKLNEFELSRISSAIKAIRHGRKNHLQREMFKAEAAKNGEEKNTSADA